MNVVHKRILSMRGRERRSRSRGNLASACRNTSRNCVLFHAVQNMTGRGGKSTKVVLPERTGGVWETLLEAVHQLGVGEHVAAAARHIVDAFGEVHLVLTLLHPRRGHGIVLGAEQVVRDEAAE